MWDTIIWINFHIVEAPVEEERGEEEYFCQNNDKIPKFDEICDYKPPKSSVNSREDELRDTFQDIAKKFWKQG